MNILDSGLHDQKRVIEAYEGYRLNNYSENNQVLNINSPRNETLVVP